MPPEGPPALAGPATAASCSSCHPQTVDTQGRILVAAGFHVDGQAQTSGAGCAGCHGDAARRGSQPGTDPNLASSPPVAPEGAPAYAVGAHLGHLDPVVAIALMPPIACAECHPVPVDSTHATRPPPQRVVFGPLSAMGGATPRWDAATGTCAATYCHGSFTFDGVTGTSAAIAWNDPAPVTCASCHTMPPAGHPAYSGTPTAASCAACHPQSVNPDGTIVAGGGHLDGRAQGGGCNSCHGDPPATGRHGEERHVTLRCDACHPTGFASDAAVAPFHRNGVVDLGSQAGYSCGLTGCPAGVQGTCTNSCHAQPQPWTGGGGGGGG
jgi:predicted CxxxxCH...CXXCH cytochrome family protein